MSATPTPMANAAAIPSSPGLPPMQLAPGAPDPASIPDMTFGYGGQTYDSFQALGAALETTLLNKLNLPALLQSLGSEAAVNEALGKALAQALASVNINVTGIPLLGPILESAQLTNAAALLKLLGFNVLDPFNLSGIATPGLNIVTAGPPFSLAKLLGIDLGWVSGFPNSVADDVNDTPYLSIGPVGLLNALKVLPGVTPEQRTLLETVVIPFVGGVFGTGSVVDVRVPVVVGFGLGAFAAGMAYPQVVAELANQPGGANNVGADPLLGSLTIMPMILVRNPGRANGGLFARAYPMAAMFGIDTVTPDTEATSSSDTTGLNIPIGKTGIVLGAANLIPVKVDATAEYDPLSDVPAWANPVSLANSVAALLFPTYLLRGVDLSSLTEVLTNQLAPQLAGALANTAGGKPLALNLYVTVPVNDALPLLEPIKLPIDVFNLVTGANLNNPLATALEPALTTLVNLGYTDVKRTVVDGVPVYDRTLDQANVITPFGTMPSGIDWEKVPGDLMLQLAAGVQKAIDDGPVSKNPVANPLAIIASLLGLKGLPGAANVLNPFNGIADLPALALGAGAAGAQGLMPLAARSQNPAPAAAKLVAEHDVAGPATNVPVSNPAAAAAAAPASVAEDADTKTGVDAPTVKTLPVKALPVKTPPVKSTSAEAAAKRAQANADASLKRATAQLDKIAKDGQQQIKNVIGDVQGNVQKTVKTVTGQDKSTDKAADKPSDGPAS